jgi:hypothetical protein
MPSQTKQYLDFEDNRSMKSYTKSFARPTTAFAQTSELPKGILKPNTLETIKKKIKMWIRAKSLLSEDVYFCLCRVMLLGIL